VRKALKNQTKHYGVRERAKACEIVIKKENDGREEQIIFGESATGSGVFATGGCFKGFR